MCRVYDKEAVSPDNGWVVDPLPCSDVPICQCDTSRAQVTVYHNTLPTHSLYLHMDKIPLHIHIREIFLGPQDATKHYFYPTKWEKYIQNVNAIQI